MLRMVLGRIAVGDGTLDSALATLLRKAWVLMSGRRKSRNS